MAHTRHTLSTDCSQTLILRGSFTPAFQRQPTGTLVKLPSPLHRIHGGIKPQAHSEPLSLLQGRCKNVLLSPPLFFPSQHLCLEGEFQLSPRKQKKQKVRAVRREKLNYLLTPLSTHPCFCSCLRLLLQGAGGQVRLPGLPYKPRGAVRSFLSKLPHSPPDPLDSFPLSPCASPLPLRLRRAATAARSAQLPSVDLAWRRRRLLKGGLEAAAADSRTLQSALRAPPQPRRWQRGSAQCRPKCQPPRLVPRPFRPPTPGLSGAQGPLSSERESWRTCTLPPPPLPLARAPAGLRPAPGTAREVVAAHRTAPAAPSIGARLNCYPHLPLLSTIKGKGDSWIFETFVCFFNRGAICSEPGGAARGGARSQNVPGTAQPLSAASGCTAMGEWTILERLLEAAVQQHSTMIGR